MPVVIRGRRDGDLEGLSDLLRAVHRTDGYPHRLPGDLEAFLSTPDQLGAWVAELDGVVVGHVLLRSRTFDEVMTVAREVAGLGEGRLGVVSRLFVGPAGRGSGAGRALLERVSAEVSARGLVGLLDVTAELTAAVALYRRAGWQRIGTTTVPFSDGSSLRQDVYLAPHDATGVAPPRATMGR